MSDTGLYSNWYERIRSMAELVDRALIELRSSSPKRTASIALKDVLTQAITSATLSRQVLTVLIKDSHSKLNLARIGSDLSGHNVPESAIEDLETLAELLEHERASTMAQLRK